jgi:hypothetical protein
VDDDELGTFAEGCDAGEQGEMGIYEDEAEGIPADD